MDRPRRRPGLLIAAAAAAASACVLAGAAPATPPTPTLRAVRWLAPGADVAAALGSRPVECLAVPKDRQSAYSVEVGRTAFRNPLLLGGVAARAGIACETCHQNGRTNPNFDFPGVSGAAGTADVTSSLFSSHRGDGIDNPKPIPDLGGAKAALKVSQDPRSGALEAFIHGLVTQEFDGAEPPPAVLQGLADYVRALSPSACPSAKREVVGLRRALDDVRRAARVAAEAAARRDWATSLVMLQSARAQLGLIAERFPGPELARQRGAVIAADHALAEIEAAERSGDPGPVHARLIVWAGDIARWSRALVSAEPRSFYAPSRLATISAPTR